MVYSAEDVLDLITGEAHEVLIVEGTKIGVVLETNFPPLVVPDEDGSWALTQWKRHGIGAWQLDYTWQLDCTYRVETFCLTVKTQGGSTVMIEGSRTEAYNKLLAKRDALNAAFEDDYTFSVEECE